MTVGHDVREQVRFWTSPELDGLELLKARYKLHVYRPHVHEGYALGVVTAGVEKFRCRQDDNFAVAGDIIIINPDTLHDGEAGAGCGWQYRMMYPREEAFDQIAQQLHVVRRGPPRFFSGLVRDPPLARKLVRLHRALEQPSSSFERQSLWLSAIGRLIRLHGHSPVRETRLGDERLGVRRAKEFLVANLSDHITLDDVARVAGLSPYHLQRVFKHQTGLSPHAFLTYMRARRAKQLIGDGEAIAQAAVASGFVDQGHLTKRFKAVFGFTPGQYRRAFHAG